MKLERLFEGKENRLFKTDGTSFAISETGIKASELKEDLCPQDKASPVLLNWTSVGLDEESYDENFLAALRDVLKELEEKGKFAFIVPVCDHDCTTPEQKEALTASFKHCARRIKDCSSVIGFAVPEEADRAFFIEELSAKHAHYVFFSGNAEALSDGAIVRIMM